VRNNPEGNLDEFNAHMKAAEYHRKARAWKRAAMAIDKANRAIQRASELENPPLKVEKKVGNW